MEYEKRRMEGRRGLDGEIRGRLEKEKKGRRAGLSHFVWEDEEGQRKNGW